MEAMCRRGEVRGAPSSSSGRGGPPRTRRGGVEGWGRGRGGWVRYHGSPPEMGSGFRVCFWVLGWTAGTRHVDVWLLWGDGAPSMNGKVDSGVRVAVHGKVCRGLW